MAKVTFVSTLDTRKTPEGKFERVIRLKCEKHGMVGLSITMPTMAGLNAATPNGSEDKPYWCPECNPEKAR